MSQWDDQTEALRLPLDESPEGDGRSSSGRTGWISRTYEFSTPGTALAFLLYTAAASRLANRWPEVLYQRYQVRVGDTQGELLDQLEADAVRLGGRCVGTNRETLSEEE